MPSVGDSMQGEHAPSVAVIGGGATGCAVARDLALRGLRVTLIEAGDLRDLKRGFDIPGDGPQA